MIYLPCHFQMVEEIMVLKQLFTSLNEINQSQQGFFQDIDLILKTRIYSRIT